MTDGPHFLAARLPDVHSARRWAQFGYLNRKLVDLVGRLISDSSLGAGSRVLDYGCAQRPYEGLVPEGIDYIGADLEGNPRADVVITPDGRLPCESGSFDAVLSTQVLEHVERPTEYLAECARVLKPGGSLMLSTHGIMYYHRDPEDYWRWTAPGLSLIVENAGFEIAEIHGVLGLSAASIQLFQDATSYRLPGPLRKIYFFVCQSLVYLFDRRQPAQHRIDNGMVLAVRAVRRSDAVS